MTFPRSLLCAVLLLLPAPVAVAWGIEGHQIIADIAEAQLTPTARQRVSEILQGARLRDVANYADEIRPFRRETSRWHFVNILPGADSYDEARDCQEVQGQGDCLIKAIERSLADVRGGGERQHEGLKFLVHFVGDLHQPFHAVTEARGGNDIAVTFFGARSNLHRVWDGDMLTYLLRDKNKLPALACAACIEAAALRANEGNVIDWAMQSREIGLRALIPPSAAIEQSYIDAFASVMQDQLVLAGLRLARLLNETFR